MNALDTLNLGQTGEQKRLSLSNGLTEFPREILDLANSLEILDLSNNQLSTLPGDIGQLKKLRVVFFNNNKFDEFPAALSACPNLSMVSFKNNNIATIGDDVLAPSIRWLTLTNNRIDVLPSTIGTLTKLQKLMLAGNKLRSLPKQLADCKNLELIRLATNQLQEFPTWLLTLPRLSWLAYAGNPFCQTHHSARENSLGRSLLTIDWDELDVGNVLGQGESGVIYKGQWTPKSDQTGTPKHRDVAIKLFKGNITSDGSPLDEMDACIAAGNHSNLVTVLGQLGRHPDGKPGLVFELLPSGDMPLGSPPSLDSCTRDTYPAKPSFTLPKIGRTARGIASAVAHLHTNGIMHGDLYAHNILMNEMGDSILSDFGAASFYDPEDSPVGNVLEMIEVRAFGCLLEDLLDRCVLAQEQEHAALFKRLRRLQHDCISPVLAQRPRFRTICHSLDDMSL
ncbi:MAG: leucine-rich repeat-containing protein kinase family protein [Cyanobacteria bacterium P01_E01_bin.6]